MNFECIRVDYHNPKHATDLLRLLQAYALDDMGGAAPLSKYAQENLITFLKSRSDAISLIIYQGDDAVAILNAVEAFSTFAAKPLMNIHDVYIEPEARGRGLVDVLFSKLEEIAIGKQCCKLTLEVLSNNHIAKSAYKKVGFNSYTLLESAGEAVFWQKSLNEPK